MSESLVLRPVGEVAEVARAVVGEVRADLQLLLTGVGVEHVGATALPTGMTKGDVDVSVRLPRERFAGAVEALRGHYEIAQPQNWTSTYASFTDRSKALPLGIQVCVRDSEDDFLVALRDLMIRDDDLRCRYDEAKRGAAPHGADAYWRAKHEFLRDVVASLR